MKLLVADYNRLAARMPSKARLDAKLAKLQYSSFQESASSHLVSTKVRITMI